MLQTSRYLNAKNKTDRYLNAKTSRYLNAKNKTDRYLNAKTKQIFTC